MNTPNRRSPTHLFSRAAAAALAIATLAAMPGAALAHSHAHDHDASPPAGMKLDHGRKWATDQALRDGMGNIRALVAPPASTGAPANLTKEQYAALSGKVQAEIGNVVANCKLAPEPDAQLHVLLGQIGAGTEAMSGKVRDLTPRQGLVKVARALNEYGRHFDHPGFEPVRTSR